MIIKNCNITITQDQKSGLKTIALKFLAMILLNYFDCQLNQQIISDLISQQQQKQVEQIYSHFHYYYKQLKMQQTDLNFEDKDVEESLKTIINEIDQKIMVKDEHIIEDLQNGMKGLTQDEQIKFKMFLNIKYKNRSFLKLGKYLDDDDDFQVDGAKDDGKQTIQDEKTKQRCTNLIQILKDSNLWQRNSISELINQNLNVLEKIELKMIELLKILGNRKKNAESYQFELLTNLLYFIYGKLPLGCNQNKIEIIIGSLLIDQIYEFQFFIENIEEQNRENFQNYISYIQNIQMKISQKNNLGGNFIENKDFKSLKTILDFSPKFNKSKLDEYLMRTLSIQDNHLNFEIIINELENFIHLQLDLQECYFKVLWYFWTQYVCQNEFLEELENYLYKIYNLTEKRKRVQQKRFQEDLQKTGEKEDIIKSYFIQNVVFFSPYKIQCSDYETFKQIQRGVIEEQKQQLLDTQSYQDLILMSKNNFLRLWSTIKKGDYRYLNQNKSNEDPLNMMLQFMWRYQPVRSIQKALKIIANLKRFSLEVCADFIVEYFPDQSQSFILNFLKISSTIKQFNPIYFNSIVKYYQKNNNFFSGDILSKFNNILVEKSTTLKELKACSTITKEEWEIICEYYQYEELSVLIKKVIDFFLNQVSKKPKWCSKFLANILPVLNIEKDDYMLCLQILVKYEQLQNLMQIFQEDYENEHPGLVNIQKTVETFLNQFNLIQDQKELEILFQNFNQFLKHKFYKCKQIFEWKLQKISNNMIHKIIEAYYYHDQENDMQLKSCCAQIFYSNEKLYEDCFQSGNFFQNKFLYPNIQKIQQLRKLNPEGLVITLEQFNISLAEMTKIEQRQLISDWIKNPENKQTFLNLLPIFFNIIKRGESPNYFFSVVSNDKPVNFIENFNMKSLFQLIYNNSNDELKVMLLKFRSKSFPVPLIYKQLVEEVKEEDSFYKLNPLLFYIFPPSYTIINFTLSSNSKQIGKTYLINQIFYEEAQPFQICDTSLINQNTIDIMFDFCYSGSRTLAIADSHGVIPRQILEKILPLFQFWIVQMNTEEELEETFSQIKFFKDTIEKLKPQICFIVRDSQIELQKKFQNLISDIKKEEINIHFVSNLFRSNLDLQEQSNEIDKVQKFILLNLEKIIQEGNKINKENFLQLFEKYCKGTEIYGQLCSGQNLLQNIEKILEQIIDEPDGFYCFEEFPMRRKNKRYLECKKKFFNIEENSKNQQVEQEKIYQIDQCRLQVLQLFSKIFDQKDSYVLYLEFVDQLRKFNGKQTMALTQQIQQLNEMIIKLKKKKTKSKPDEENNEELVEIKKKLEIYKKEIKKVRMNLTLKNIGIEIFWREIVQHQQLEFSKLSIKPAKNIFEMIEKGEPFEFLDGDELKINQYFLESLFNNYEKNNKRVLVLSVLGPQSSGKSTILNKIFGCHFWTSVGRCTKGIYLQILKVENKALFDYEFDYIFLLDTEGLQNPEQQDPDFDKKIALFILLISDIIIINVKGEISQQFRNLVEMCIYNLGRMKTNFQMIKLLSWCFNQNNDANNVDPFLAQLQGISDNLNHDNIKVCYDDIKLDYSEILDINKQNIKVLGFSSYEKNWKGSNSTEYFKDCKQLNANDTYSSEAYSYGIQTIKNFVKKFKEQKDEDEHLQTLNNFVTGIEEKWNSIQMLPDLLEFTELIQHQQNQLMKEEYEKIQNGIDFSFMKNIKLDIEKEMEKMKQKKTTQFFRKIQKEQEEQYNIQLEDKKKEARQQIENIKKDKKISKKITQKYLNQLDNFMMGQVNYCKTQIFDIIGNKEREYQKQQGFELINKFIVEIYSKPQQLSEFQKNPDKIKLEFDRMWKQTVDQVSTQQKQLFTEFQSNQYNSTISQTKEYQLNTDHSEEYQDFFKNINKLEPDFKSEKLQILEQYQKELQTPQFMILDKYSQKNSRYHDLFYQNIYNKLRNATSMDLLDIRQFYKIKIEYKVISKQNFEEYLKISFIQDLKALIIKSSKKEKCNYQIHDFFILLNELQITYDSESLAIMKDLLARHKIIQWYKSVEFEEAVANFTDSLKLDHKACLVIKNEELLKQINEFYPSLEKQFCRQEFEGLTYSELQENYSNIIKDQVVIKYYITVSPTKTTTLFEYIQFAKQKEIIRNYTSILPQEFNKLMESYSGWQKIYDSIYDLIQIETFNQNRSRIEFSDENYLYEEEISNFNNSTLKNIMKKIEKQIEEFNIQFSLFGFILNHVGVRCIQYYSVLVIWRFGCYKKWQNLVKHQQELENDYEIELQKFSNEIIGNKIEQSKLKAEILVKHIYTEILNKAYAACQEECISKLIDKNKIKCVDLIKQLDEKLLLQDFSQQQILDNKILMYTKNQLEYVQQYANEYVKRIELEIINLLHTNKEIVLQQLTDILKNALKIKETLQDEELKIRSYFSSNFQEQINDDFYEYLLFEIVFDSIQGIENKNTQHIADTYQQLFSQQFQQTKKKIESIDMNNTDKKIQQFKCFINQVCQQLEKQIKLIDQSFQVHKGKLNYQKNLEDLKIQMIGCLFECPICNRKCDLDPHDSSQQHECRNGHQLRGMNQLLVGSVPSLYSCEELENDYQIRDPKTNNQCSWAEKVSQLKEWKFKSFSDEKLIEHKSKMTKIWNGGFGRLLCSKIKENKKNVFFREKHDFKLSQEKIHYIFLLDSSRSMAGDKWKTAERGFKHCIKQLQQNQNARVSVMIFDEDAYFKFELQKPEEIHYFWSLIWFTGGTANLNLTLQKVKSHLQKSTSEIFSRTIIFMYTSGDATYPQDGIRQFKKIEEQIRSTITFIVATETQNSATLSQIVKDINPYVQEAVLQSSIKPDQIELNWGEAVSGQKQDK